MQLDADASIETPGWLERMVAFFLSGPARRRRDRKGRVRLGRDPDVWRECGRARRVPRPRYGDHRTRRQPHLPRARRALRARANVPPCEAIAEVDGGAGCCMMYRRDVALELGGYDPGYAPVWFDDLDLTLCIRRHGLKVFYMPDVRVIHHVSAPSRAAAPARRLVRGRVAGSHLRQRIARLGSIRCPASCASGWTTTTSIGGRSGGSTCSTPTWRRVSERWGDTELCWRANPEMRDGGSADRRAVRSARAVETGG